MTVYRLLFVMFLAACTPVPVIDDGSPPAGTGSDGLSGTDPLNDGVVDDPPDVFDENGTVVRSGPGDLLDREPDTCGAQSLQNMLGQSASIVPGLALEGPFRIVKPDDIVTQEYNAQRVNFRVNGSGIVTRVSCG